MADKEEKSPKRDRVDLTVKIIAPLVAGLLIAWAGFISERALSNISSREESARLITELQVNREKAESDLRKDVFDKALNALLSNDTNYTGVRGLSKRLLRLELLALNFGDSLSLSPLFTDFKRDLDGAELAEGEDSFDQPLLLRGLEMRLQSLAKRVAGSQLSSIAQHGSSVPIIIPLPQGTAEITCKQYLHEGYNWPNDAVNSEGSQLSQLTGTEGYEALLAKEIATRSTLELGGVKRRITLTFTNADPCSKTVRVFLQIHRVKDKPKAFQGSNGSPDENLEVERGFDLNFYNFPKIDNTRLSNNQRFALVMEEFSTKNSPQIEITGVIFPAEYASLRDRPGMNEAMQLLQRALRPDDNDQEPTNQRGNPP